ncbi:MAG: hypothetical protein OEV40_03600 [Acidimicrobiia bacterium]|nr:hypothetical protein [Acidimicrobiia bacterium]
MSQDRTTTARIRYIDPEWRDASEPPRIGSRDSRHACTSYREVVVHDARIAGDGLGVDTSGFTLCTHSTTAAGRDRARVRRDYHPAMLDLVRQLAGATRTYLLADLVRTEDQSNFNYAYARFVHCDYHPDNLERMSRDLLARNDVEPENSWTYAWYNTWQPFDNVVRQNPLAVLDVRSIAPGDIIPYRYTGYARSADDPGGLVSAPVYNPDHRWYYYPEMTPDEVLLTKQLDPRPGRAAQCPHTSFVDDSQPADVPPRRSIETRILAVFEP